MVSLTLYELYLARLDRTDKLVDSHQIQTNFVNPINLI